MKLEVGDEVKFEVRGVTYTGTVVKDQHDGYYMNFGWCNDIVFTELGIDKRTFTYGVLGYVRAGQWPYCKSLEDLAKLVQALLEECSRHSKTSGGILIQDGSCLEIDTSVMQWSKDLENMPKDGTCVFVFSQYGERWLSVHWSKSKSQWVISGRTPYQVFPETAIHAYCIPTVPEWAERN
jgi:hypothetical protein